MGIVNRRNRRPQAKVRIIRTGYEVRYPGVSQPFIVHFDALADVAAGRLVD